MSSELEGKKSLLLRLSPELWEELQKMAADEFRSINAQIEYLLHEAVRRRRPRQSAPPPGATDEIRRLLGAKDSEGIQESDLSDEAQVEGELGNEEGQFGQVS